MKSWLKAPVAAKREKAWKFAKSLRDARQHPWLEEELALAAQFVALELDVAAYRAAIVALTDWNAIKNRADFGGYTQQERDYRADVVATMEMTVVQSELM